MTSSPTHFPLTPKQLEKLHFLSAQTGKPETQILDDMLAGALPETEAEPDRNSQQKVRTAYDAFSEAGLIGSFEGLDDLSTNPKYMEGFGESKRSQDQDTD
jgi:hypothetical protein